VCEGDKPLVLLLVYLHEEMAVVKIAFCGTEREGTYFESVMQMQNNYPQQFTDAPSRNCVMSLLRETDLWTALNCFLDTLYWISFSVWLHAITLLRHLNKEPVS
jgi:hypothetical protein